MTVSVPLPAGRLRVVETGVVDVGDREPGDHEGRVLERALGQGQGVDRQVIDRVDGHVDGGGFLTPPEVTV
ncbi:MAG: hypothetical protein IPN78_01865 [Candidatus Accumulibacter sp.]|nr:hypothetical protein [Candidatus Accumulibacter propinquus]